MNIKEKEAYIEYLKDTLESINYPDNPFSKYVIIDEYYESSMPGCNENRYKEQAAAAFSIAQSLSTDIME
jgi:hypothetical protein